MGDHRPKITCHFEMHGHKADYDFGHCNWCDNGNGIDARIVYWFRAQSEIAMDRWRAGIRKNELSAAPSELDSAAAAVIEAARGHSCGMKIGHPLITNPCGICNAIAAFDAAKGNGNDTD